MIDENKLLDWLIELRSSKACMIVGNRDVCYPQKHEDLDTKDQIIQTMIEYSTSRQVELLNDIIRYIKTMQ